MSMNSRETKFVCDANIHELENSKLIIVNYADIDSSTDLNQNVIKIEFRFGRIIFFVFLSNFFQKKNPKKIVPSDFLVLLKVLSLELGNSILEFFDFVISSTLQNFTNNLNQQNNKFVWNFQIIVILKLKRKCVNVVKLARA